MPPKKIKWGDIPNEEHVKEKDSSGKGIECCVCQQVFKVRATFDFAEWLNHCSSAKHCEEVKINDLNNTTIDFFLHWQTNCTTKTIHLQLNSNKRNKTILACPGFIYGKIMNCCNYKTSIKND